MTEIDTIRAKHGADMEQIVGAGHSLCLNPDAIQRGLEIGQSSLSPANVRTLLAHIDTLTAERNFLEQNETVVWEVLQIPDGSTIHDVAAAVFKLRQELAAAKDDADEIARDSEILLGAEWQRSVQAVNGDPDAAREHRIAALVADLDEANARADGERAKVVAWLKQRADDQEDRGDDIAIRLAADAIERGDFEQ